MSTESYSGIGVTEVLTLIFIVLKLLEVITWSWWWVFSPLWIVWGLVIFFFLVVLLLGILRH